MITNDEQLQQTFEQLQRLYRVISTLRTDVLPRNADNFALFAEGPLDQIRRLREEIDTYTGVRAAEESDADVWLRLQGSELTWPDAPTSVLTAFLDAFRKGVQVVADQEVADGQQYGSGDQEDGAIEHREPQADRPAHQAIR